MWRNAGGTDTGPISLHSKCSTVYTMAVYAKWIAPRKSGGWLHLWPLAESLLLTPRLDWITSIVYKLWHHFPYINTHTCMLNEEKRGKKTEKRKRMVAANFFRLRITLHETWTVDGGDRERWKCNRTANLVQKPTSRHDCCHSVSCFTSKNNNIKFGAIVLPRWKQRTVIKGAIFHITLLQFKEYYEHAKSIWNETKYIRCN